NNIEHGQINLPVLALCVWSIVYAREERPKWSGTMIAAAVLIKPFAVLAAIYLALRRNWAALAWAIVAGAILFVLPVIVFGPRGLVEQTVAYLRSVASMTERYRTMLTNQSAVAAVARLTVRFGDEATADGAAPFWIGMAFEAALVAVASLWILRSRPADDGDRIAADRYALAGLFCLMGGFAPISWKSYFAALVVPYLLLVDELWKNRTESRLAWALFIASAALNFAPGRYLNRVALFYSAHLLSSILALGTVAVLSLGKHGPQIASHEISAQATHAS